MAAFLRSRALLQLMVIVIGGPSAGCGPDQRAPRGDDAEAASPWFLDTAQSAGLRFRHVNGASGRYYYPETNGSGCAWFDADGDGWIDAFLVNGAPLPGYANQSPTSPALFLNDGRGGFRNATAASGLDAQLYGTGCAAGDYDGDGRMDLYVAATLGPGRLYRNMGSGRFGDVTRAAGVANAGHWGTSPAWLDYDRDGKLDLFVGNYIRYKLGSDTPCLYSEGYKTYCGPQWFQPDHPSLLRNLGGGRFEDVSVPTGLAGLRQKALGVALLDFDDDGYCDLFVANDVWEQHLLHNTGSGSRRRFREVGSEFGVAYSEAGKSIAGMGVDVADLHGDGRHWIASANFSGEGVAVFRQDSPKGSFRDTSRSLGTTQASLTLLGFGLSWIDTDNNGLKEILVANGHVHPEVQSHSPHLSYAEPKLLLEWDRQSRFRDVSAQGGAALMRPTVSRGLAVGDYDNDGRVDALVNNLNGDAQLLHNQRPSGHWLGIELEGRASNRSGIGARVIVSAAGRTWRDLCRSGGSYVSHNDVRLHFGLGEAASVDRIVVKWPSGRTDVHRGVLPDAYYRLVEGQSRPERLGAGPEAR